MTQSIRSTRSNRESPRPAEIKRSKDEGPTFCQSSTPTAPANSSAAFDQTKRQPIQGRLSRGADFPERSSPRCATQNQYILRRKCVGPDRPEESCAELH